MSRRYNYWDFLGHCKMVGIQPNKQTYRAWKKAMHRVGACDGPAKTIVGNPDVKKTAAVLLFESLWENRPKTSMYDGCWEGMGEYFGC